MIVEDQVRQVSFTNVSFNIGKETLVILEEEKYVYVNVVDQFSGELVKTEENKEVEPFLREIIDEYQPSGVFSPYPPDTITNYSILFKLEDLQKVVIVDPLIINNIDDKEILKELLNERASISLKNYEPWDILPKPTEKIHI